MKKLTCKVVGNNELRVNNPQSADPLNKYAKKFKELNANRRKTDSDIENMRNMEIEAKLYFNDELGIYVPTTWVMASLAAESFKQCKISKANARGAIFFNNTKIKLYYEKIKTVKKIEDIVLDPFFRTTELLKQGQVKIAKGIPTFTNWYFHVELEFDEEVITSNQIELILNQAVARNGFGDFRPTYGRGTVEDLVIEDI